MKMKIGIIFNIVAFFLLGADIINICIGCGGTIKNNGLNKYTEVQKYRGSSANCIWRFTVSEAEVLYLKLQHLWMFYYDDSGEKQCEDSYIRLVINGQSVDCMQSITDSTGSICYTFSRTQHCRNEASSLSCFANDVISSGSSTEVQYYAKGLTPSGGIPHEKSGIRFQYIYMTCDPSDGREPGSETTLRGSTTKPKATASTTTTTTAPAPTTVKTTASATATRTKPTTTIPTTFSTTTRKSITIPATVTRPATSRRGTPMILTTTSSATARNVGDEAKKSIASTTIKSAAHSKQSLPSAPDEMISATSTMSIKYPEPEYTAPHNNPDTTTIIVIAAGTFLLLVTGIIVFVIRRRRRIRNGHMQQSVSLDEYGFENAYAEATGSRELKENVLYGGVHHETVETNAAPVVNAAVNKVASEGAAAPVVYAAVNKAASETATVPAVYAEVNKVAHEAATVPGVYADVNKVAHEAATVPDVYAEVNKVASEADQAQIDNNGQRTQAFSTFKCDY